MFGGCLHSDFKECDLYRKIVADKKGKKWAKGLSWYRGEWCKNRLNRKGVIRIDSRIETK
jgi:hypothetical protein